ncbi:NAD(P)H-dependent amine dehydrogenase family protein [Nocardia bovistercoris]|uniref:Dihydrodipicolinate reductase n=1 Tax=Nocardia bovistercoris TaxID=2785916 RepID=A0A931I9C7_9NOCA|nr:dihydrodipicolinate reductase [Nocardia bovistercoris]MBH0776265.1 dihydrodipicolinate reductase [Nocardia bovistercoris]
MADNVEQSRYRVVQWTTGNVGKQSVSAVVAHPELELVGCYAWSPDKVGRDAGELSDIEPVGVLATDDVAALLALKPDCVVYNPMWIDVDELVRILESGVNVVTTAAFVTGHSLGADKRARIVDACERGGSTIFGSGINPGFVDLLAIVAAGAVDRIDKITVVEEADISGYDSPATELPVGFARPIDDPELPAMTASATEVFIDAVHLIGAAIGVEFDEVVCEPEYARTTHDVDLGSWRIDAGCVAGIRTSWHGKVDGRSVVELRTVWRKGQTLEPDWPIDTGHRVIVDGCPNITLRMDVTPPPDFVGTTLSDFMRLPMILTAMPAITAIPNVVAAAPGILTYADTLPLPKARITR